MTVVRERAIWNDQVVTVLRRRVRTVEIRDAFGYPREVPKRQVKKIDADDPLAKFTAPDTPED